MLVLKTIVVNIIVSLQPADCCVKAKTINTNRQLILCSKKVIYSSIVSTVFSQVHVSLTWTMCNVLLLGEHSL